MMAITPPANCRAAPNISTEAAHGTIVMTQPVRLADRLSVKKNPHSYTKKPTMISSAPTTKRNLPMTYSHQPIVAVGWTLCT